MLIQQLRLGSGGEDASTQSLGEHQDIPLPGAAVCEDGVRMCKAGNAQAVLGFLILNAVASGDHRPSLGHLVRAPGQDIPHRLHRQAGGEGQQVHGQLGLPPHGVYIGEGVDSGDLPKSIGVIHHRREEVHRLDHGQLITDLIDCRVVALVKAHQQSGVGHLGQAGQYIP